MIWKNVFQRNLSSSLINHFVYQLRLFSEKALITGHLMYLFKKFFFMFKHYYLPSLISNCSSNLTIIALFVLITWILHSWIYLLYHMDATRFMLQNSVEFCTLHYAHQNESYISKIRLSLSKTWCHNRLVHTLTTALSNNHTIASGSMVQGSKVQLHFIVQTSVLKKNFWWIKKIHPKPFF